MVQAGQIIKGTLLVFAILAVGYMCFVFHKHVNWNYAYKQKVYNAIELRVKDDCLKEVK